MSPAAIAGPTTIEASPAIVNSAFAFNSLSRETSFGAKESWAGMVKARETPSIKPKRSKVVIELLASIPRELTPPIT